MLHVEINVLVVLDHQKLSVQVAYQESIYTRINVIFHVKKLIQKLLKMIGVEHVIKTKK